MRSRACPSAEGTKRHQLAAACFGGLQNMVCGLPTRYIQGPLLENCMKQVALVIGVILAVTCGYAVSHGGGLDQSGCHHDRKNGGYHCHR
jgi:hypothetical protein